MRYVAFLRAINVAGHPIIRMEELRSRFRRAGGSNVATFIQSGNVLFDAARGDALRIVRRVAAGLHRKTGVKPQIVVRRLDEIEGLMRRSPFQEFPISRAIKLYVAFLARKPRSKPELPLVSIEEALEVVRIERREAFLVSRPKPRGMFGFPNNFIEERLGVPATTRNWSTIAGIVAKYRLQAPGKP